MSPAPWEVNSSGGAITIVARDRSVVAVVVGSDASAPFDRSNADLMAAAPDFSNAAQQAKDNLWQHTRGCPSGECWHYRLAEALAKATAR